MGRPNKIPVNKIDLEASPRPRAEINKDVVTDYAEHFRAGVRLPPVTLFRDGERYLIGDGWHRTKAAILASGQEVDSLDDDLKIEAMVREGTLRDCTLFAVGSNADHGLRRTNADKQKAVELLLRDAEWGKRSDSWIAEQCKVSDKTVAKIRADLQPTSEIRSERKGKDGRVISTARIGKRPKKVHPAGGTKKAGDPTAVQPDPPKEPDGDPLQEVRQVPTESTQPVISKLPGGPKEPARDAGGRDPVPEQMDPLPVSKDAVEVPCRHVEDLFTKGFAYRLRGQAILRVRDEYRNGFERELNFCPICGQPVVQARVSEDHLHGHGGVETAVSSPMSA